MGLNKQKMTGRWRVAETFVEKGQTTEQVQTIAHKFVVVVLLACFLHLFDLTTKRTIFPENDA